jgi:V8-like Glu-specific endopeptidase
MKHLVVTFILIFGCESLFAFTFAPINKNIETEAAVADCNDGSCGNPIYQNPLLHNVALYGPYAQVEKTVKAYSPIGAINNDSNKSTGTAFLISPCHVLTNYHVLFEEKEPTTKISFNFNIGKSDTNDFAVGVAAKPVELGNYSQSENICEDFAVLQLDQCVGDEYGYVQVLPLSLEKIKQLQESKIAVKSAGFPRTMSYEKVSVDEDCEVSGMHVLDNEAYAHTCNSMKNQSGGPIFFESTKKQKLIVFAISAQSIKSKSKSVKDNTLLEGDKAKDPKLKNMAVPISCIYDRIKKYIPDEFQVSSLSN